MQVPPLLVTCSMMVLYGVIQPYKSQVANVVELIIQTNFFILLALESISFLDSTFSPAQTMRGGTSLNETDICKDGISPFTTIHLIIFYAPLLLFATVAIFKLVIYVRYVNHPVKLHMLYIHIIRTLPLNNFDCCTIILDHTEARGQSRKAHSEGPP